MSNTRKSPVTTWAAEWDAIEEEAEKKYTDQRARNAHILSYFNKRIDTLCNEFFRAFAGDHLKGPHIVFGYWCYNDQLKASVSSFKRFLKKRTEYRAR